MIYFCALRVFMMFLLLFLIHLAAFYAAVCIILFFFFDWSVKCASHLEAYKTRMEYKIWMASDWKNNVSGTFYAVAGSNPKQPLPPFGFYMNFITCSEINNVTVLLLNTNFIQGVVQILGN